MNIRELEAGTVISFNDLPEITKFEDKLAHELDPLMEGEIQDFWDGRAPFRTLIRPAGFNGTIADPDLCIMDDPYDRYLDAKARGRSFSKGAYFLPKKDVCQADKDTYTGFIFTANALSTAYGLRQIQAEVWYSSYGMLKTKRSSLRGMGQSSIKRVISTPEIVTTDFIVPGDSARQIGFGAILHT